MTKVVVDTDTQEQVSLSQSGSTLTVTETGSVALLNQSESFSAITAVDSAFSLSGRLIVRTATPVSRFSTVIVSYVINFSSH